MRGSIQLGRVLGIPLRVHFTFVLLLAFIAFAALLTRGGTPTKALWSVVFIVALFASVVLHELSHSLVARSYGVRVESITLLPIGGVAAMQDMPRRPSQEALMAIAGPAMSLAIAGVMAAVVFGAGLKGPVGYMNQPILPALVYTNIAIAIFNLLPAFPMDGGRVLRAGLAQYMGLARATQIAVTVGQVLAICIGLGGILILQNVWLALIAVFIYIGAGQEGRQVQTQALLEGITARQAMIVRFETLRRHETLGTALAYATQGYQHDFPVVEGDTIVGVVTRQDLLYGLHHLGPHHTVGEVMTTAVCQAAPETAMADVYRNMAQGACGIVLVREGDRIVGLVTPDSVRDQLIAGATGAPGRPMA